MSRSLRDSRRDLANCTWCPKLCRFCCPTAEVEHRETVTPWFKMSLAEMVRQGRAEAAGEYGEVFLHCFGCLHCRTHCEHENDVPAALYAARRLALRAGEEAPAVAALLDRFRDSGNPWGEDLDAALRAAVDERFFVPEAQAVVFAGCQAIRAGGRELTPLFALFDRLGVDHVGIFHQGPLCCGAPLWQAGDAEGFAAHARDLAARLAGVRQVICPCPTCAHILMASFAEADVPLAAQVVTLDAFLAPRVADRPPPRRLGGAVALHDPCYSSRYLERGAALRELLAAVLAEPLCEPSWADRDALCCGGGGLVPHTLPQVAAGAARLRAAQLDSTGAGRVVTACPGCVRQLDGAGRLPVLDLAELLLEAYRAEP